jgi:hypothetical protein
MSRAQLAREAITPFQNVHSALSAPIRLVFVFINVRPQAAMTRPRGRRLLAFRDPV